MIPRLLALFLGAVLAGLPAVSSAQVSPEQQQLAQKLFNPEATLEEFVQASEAAAKAGVPGQVLAESKLIRGLRRQDAEYLETILPELEAAATKFSVENSAGFGSVEEFRGLIAYARAIGAAKKGDEATLKGHFAEAFWLAPNHRDAFAELLNSHRVSKGQPPEQGKEPHAPDMKLMEKLLDPKNTQEQFESALAEAAKSGVSADVLAEVKLIWALRYQEDAYLEKIIPELDALMAKFEKGAAPLLATATQFKALVSYLKAVLAASKGDEAGLKSNITEAFWTDPSQGERFARSMMDFQTDIRMKKVTVDFAMPLTTSQGQATTFRDVIGSNKALLVDFWASWCGPCMMLMPALREKAQHLAKHGVVVAGINTESDESIAEKVRLEKDMKLPWLVDPKGNPLARLLEATTLPRMILLSPEGKVLYSGHPQDPRLLKALQKVNPEITTLGSSAEVPAEEGAAPGAAPAMVSPPPASATAPPAASPPAAPTPPAAPSSEPAKKSE